MLTVGSMHDNHNVSSSVRHNKDGRMWTNDPDTCTIDLIYLRFTDLPVNGFVNMPPPLKDDGDIKFQNIKHDLGKEADKFMNKIKFYVS